MIGEIFSGTNIGVVYLLIGVVLLVLLRQPLDRPGKPGSKGFFLAVLAVSLWPLSTGVNVFVTDLGASIAIWNVRLLAASVVSVGWFLLAYEFTRARMPSRTVLFLLGGYVVLSQLLAWTNGWHLLVLEQGTAVRGGVLVPEYGPWFWVQALVNYGFILGATGLLSMEWSGSRGLRRAQSALLALAVIPPIAANLVTILGVVETVYDLTPFGLIGTALILSWTLYRLEFLNVVPIGRDTAVEVMEDAVVTLDAESRVVDSNPTAQRLFDIEVTERPTVDTALDSLPAHVFESIDEIRRCDDGATDFHADLSVELTDRERHLSVSGSAVTGAGQTYLGQVLVFRDITPIKRREEELELLQQILTRVLRHNLRNKLTTIQGNAQVLGAEYDDERIDQIRAAGESVIDIAEKTRHLQRIVQPNSGDSTYDLSVVVPDAVDAVRDRYPDASITVDAPESCPVRVWTGLPVVVENLVENGVEHNDSATKTVEVTVEDRPDRLVLEVADNGPGISDYELAVLEAREETPLRHGSGIGLWLIKWWTDRSGTSLQFETGEEGTVARIGFPESARVDS